MHSRTDNGFLLRQTGECAMLHRFLLLEVGATHLLPIEVLSTVSQQSLTVTRAELLRGTAAQPLLSIRIHGWRGRAFRSHLRGARLDVPAVVLASDGLPASHTVDRIRLG